MVACRGFKTSDLRRTADVAEHSMQQQAQGVQHCMQGLHDTFKDVSASLQSLQASLRNQIPAAHAQAKVSCVVLIEFTLLLVLWCIQGVILQ